MGKRRDLPIAKRGAGAAQAATNDDQEIARPQASLLDARSKRDEIFRAKGVLKLRQGAKRQTQTINAPAQLRFDFTAM